MAEIDDIEGIDEFQELEQYMPDGQYVPPNLSTRKGDMVLGNARPPVNGKVKQTWRHTRKELLHAFQLSVMGCSSAQIGEFFGVPKYTIDNWKVNRPEFAEALRKGKEKASMKVATALYKIAVGYNYEEVKTMEGTNSKGDPISYEIRTTRHVPPNVKAIIFYLTNRERGLWTDVTKLEIGNADPNGKPMDLSKLSPEEQALARKLAILQISGSSGTSINQ